MKIVKKIWDEFVYGGHFLALGDAITLYVLAIILNIAITWDFLTIIYLCVFVSNLYNRREEAESDALTNPERVKVMKKYVDSFRAIASVSILIVISLLMYFANVKVLLFAVVIFIISILYSVFLKGITNKIIGFKSFVAAFFYALMVFLLVFYYGASINLAVLLVFSFYYLRIFISNAACDIKDIEGDNKRGLKTFSVYFGDKKSALMLGVINVLSVMPIMVGVYLGVLPFFSIAIIATIPYAFLYLRQNQKVGKETLTNLIIDGEFMLWLPYLLIVKVLL